MSSPSPRKRVRLPRKWGVSLSAVELCAQNAERLFVDATKVSAPTTAALAELSIEESAKGWMLYFRLLLQGQTVKAPFRVSRKEAKPITDFLESRADYLVGLDGDILLAFRRHEVKLRFLAFLLEFLEKSVPMLAAKDRPVQIAQTLQGHVFDVRQSFAPPDPAATLALIRSFRREFLTELSQVKERGFYVNLSDSRREMVSPDIQQFPTPLLLGLAALLFGSLKANLLLLTK